MSDKSFDGKGKLNIYTCPKCGGHIVTVDREKGVTPFMISCKQWINPNCDQWAESSFYRVQDQRMKPSHEWYRATESEILKMKNSAACFEHHDKGGLFLRKIEEEETTKPSKIQVSIEGYRAENSKHGWTGRAYSLDPFFVYLNKEGEASIGFSEEHANYEQDDESSRTYIYCSVPVSEVIALRDYLNEAFPLEPEKKS